MTISFKCDQCGKTVKAPDSAAGKKGKCPYCETSVYIPAETDEDDLIPLAPLQDEREQTDSEAVHSLERELLREQGGGGPTIPLEQKGDLSSTDLHHFVVNYCMDMFNGNLERAQQNIQGLKVYKYTAMEAVEDFETGKAVETVLDSIPKKVRMGFLSELKSALR